MNGKLTKLIMSEAQKVHRNLLYEGKLPIPQSHEEASMQLRRIHRALKRNFKQAVRGGNRSSVS